MIYEEEDGIALGRMVMAGYTNRTIMMCFSVLVMVKCYYKSRRDEKKQEGEG